MRALIVLLAICLFASAADKKPAPVRGGNDSVDLIASGFADRESVTAALGVDPGVDMVVVEVNLTPKGEEELSVWRDDFILISRRDGQKSQPLAPTQIAGKGALVVSSRGGGASGIGMGQQRGPIWGGVPGTGGRPRRLGGDDDVGGVVSGAETRATMDAKSAANDPLLESLKAKVLPEKKTKEPITGQLYFILDGKHKLKDLELMYGAGANRVILDFIK